MATFTMRLKDVVKMEHGKVGLDVYPIFDEAYRATLNQKILDHYWNQEIGQESIEMWRFAMRRRMNEIMPLYNQHYKLSLLDVDPLSTVSIKAITESDSDGTTTSTGSNESTSNAKSRAVASDTPQTALQPNAAYASSMQDNTSDSSAESSATDNQEVKQKATQDAETTGYSGHAPILIYEARRALVNIDMLIINDLRDLFMLIWSNNDSFTGRHYCYYGY
jgi:hypothetical protein